MTQLENQIAAQDEQLPRNAGFLRSFSNVVCIIIGTGCLQIPYAFAKSGWIGIIVIVLSAFIGSYTGVLTIRCLYYRGDGQRLHSFPQIGRAAFGRWGQYATQFFNYLYSLGTTCLYIILSGQFIYQLVSTLGVGVSKKVWMIVVTVIMWVPVAILKEMSEAAILAIFGLLASVVVIVISTIMSLVKPYTAMYPGEPEPGHDIAIGIGIPVALSSIVFSFAGSVVYPHVEASMKKPKQWPTVVFTAMGFCAAAYLLIGITGYWAYGDQVVSPVLDSIPTGAPATVAKIMITLHVIIAAPIMLLSFYLEVEKQWDITAERLGKKKEFTVRLIYRTVVVGIVCGISLAIPYFSDFLSLISSIACVTMFAIIPIVCYLKLYGHRVAPWYEKIWMVVVLAIGAVACIWGSIDAIKSLIQDTKGGSS
ncbi:transmembrane amino acid transporter protein-domain-containing protein [Coemansia spiralis]|nr:transmembrane amino acid transporter protein-domain-containing protein [Coemansia spiralis]